MPNFYIYLIASLPLLQFGAHPPFSFEKFLRVSSKFIPDDDFETLKKSSIDGDYINEASHPTLKRWREFDTALKNELVKIRAGHRHIDPLKYMRHDGYFDTSLSHIAMAAYRNPSPLEGERVLDLERWRMLDEIATGHYFDLDFLITYAHKLLILERWERIEAADKPRILEEALSKG